MYKFVQTGRFGQAAWCEALGSKVGVPGTYSSAVLRHPNVTLVTTVNHPHRQAAAWPSP